MMREEFRRSELLLWPQALERLAGAHAAVFGVGGVGGHAAEALARAGVGSLTLFDSDTVALSNINRQIAATHATLGQYKVDVMAARIRDINPQARVTCMPVFYTVEDAPKYSKQQLNSIERIMQVVREMETNINDFELLEFDSEAVSMWAANNYERSAEDVIKRLLEISAMPQKQWLTELEKDIKYK